MSFCLGFEPINLSVLSNVKLWLSKLRPLKQLFTIQKLFFHTFSTDFYSEKAGISQSFATQASCMKIVLVHLTFEDSCKPQCISSSHYAIRSVPEVRNSSVLHHGVHLGPVVCGIWNLPMSRQNLRLHVPMSSRWASSSVLCHAAGAQTTADVTEHTFVNIYLSEEPVKLREVCRLWCCS